MTLKGWRVVKPQHNQDPDQTAPKGAVWSVSTLFAYVILSDALVFEFLGHLPYMLYLMSYDQRFNDTLTNDIVSFEQQGLGNY